MTSVTDAPPTAGHAHELMDPPGTEPPSASLLGVIQVVLGFLFQDRLGLTARDTAGAAGAAGFATGLVLVAVQGGLVPRLGWSPVRLLRVGPRSGSPASPCSPSHRSSG